MLKTLLEKHPDACIGVILVAITLVPFAQVGGHEFVNYDDNEYVTDNPQVKQGLTAETVAWAFTGSLMGHWQPLVALSHLLDVQVFGLEAGGHHLTNLWFHLANTLLLFGLLRRMTGARWRSAAVALLFAIHPLHVEPVAWVSSRKDVLSTFFLLLTLLAYARYAKRPAALRYLLVFLFYCLGLMCKATLVTAPALLLLLDYWPLARFEELVAGKWRHWRSWRPLWEKLPLAVPTAAMSVITYRGAAAYGMAGPTEFFTWPVRIANATLAYGQYIARMLWPRHLSSFYPHPGADVALSKVGLSAVLLVCVTVAVVRLMRRCPYLAVGWFWYLGTLVPVIGLVQSVHYAAADRYTYVPLIGLFVMMAWGVPDALARPRQGRVALGVVTAVIVAALTAASWFQVRVWRNSLALASHTVNLTEDNAAMRNNLGMALVEQGRLEEAQVHFARAIQISDHYFKGHYNMAVTLEKQGKDDQAVAEYRKALEVIPDDVSTHYNLGNLLRRLGHDEEGIALLTKAVELDPDHADAHYNLGMALEAQGRVDEAIAHYKQAVRAKPDYSEAYNNLGIALARRGDLAQAEKYFRDAVRCNPQNAEAFNNLGAALLRQGNLEKAVEYYEEALRIDPGHATARRNLERIRNELKRRGGVVSPPG